MNRNRKVSPRHGIGPRVFCLLRCRVMAEDGGCLRFIGTRHKGMDIIPKIAGFRDALKNAGMVGEAKVVLSRDDFHMIQSAIKLELPYTVTCDAHPYTMQIHGVIFEMKR